MEVHRVLGPGFLEAVYQKALVSELSLQGIRFEEFKQLPVYYKEKLVGNYEADIVVEDQIILEIKSVSALNDRHRAQAIHCADRLVAKCFWHPFANRPAAQPAVLEMSEDFQV